MNDDSWCSARLRDRRSRLFSLGLRPCPLRTEIPPDSLNLLIMLCTVEGEISKSLPIFLWGTLFLNISIIFSRFCWQTGDPRPIFDPKGLDLSWMLLLYQIIITITCWHQLFQITSLFNQFTSLLALNCSCPNFFWNVLQVWMTGKDVYLQMTWSWPDKTWNILCSYCLQWNTSQSKFRNHYFLFLFAFSILSQLFLIWGCRLKGLVHPKIIIYSPYVCRILGIDSLSHQSLSQHNNFPYGESEGWLRSFSLAFSFVFHGRKKVIQVWNNMSVSNTKYLTIDRQKEIELCQLSLILNSFIIIKERLLDICITCLYTHTENK